MRNTKVVINSPDFVIHCKNCGAVFREIIVNDVNFDPYVICPVCRQLHYIDFSIKKTKYNNKYK